MHRLVTQIPCYCFITFSFLLIACGQRETQFWMVKQQDVESQFSFYHGFKCHTAHHVLENLPSFSTTSLLRTLCMLLDADKNGSIETCSY